MEDVQKKIKGFFERPEGTTGLIFIGIGIVAFLFAGNYIMPFIIAALANTLYAMLLGGAILFILFLVMNPRVRAFASLAFVMTMRWLTSIFITIDPIGVLKLYLGEMDEKIQDVDENIGNLNGQKKKLEANIEQEKKRMEGSLRKADVANRQNMKHEAALNGKNAARSRDVVRRLTGIKEKMEKLLEALHRMRKSVKFLRDDTAEEIRVKELEYKATNAAHGAMKAAQALLHGGTMKDLYDEATEHLVEDVATKMGHLETFFELSEDFMTNVDLQNDVWDEEGMAMLEKWLENDEDILDYENKRKVRVETNTGPQQSIIGDGNVQVGGDFTTTQETVQATQLASFFKRD